MVPALRGRDAVTVEMQRQMRERAVTVLAVSVDDDASDYHKFLKDHGIDLLTGVTLAKKTKG